MDYAARKGYILIVVIFLNVGLARARRYEYLDELCKDSSSPKLRLGFHLPKDRHAFTLSLSQSEYPAGLNCCLTIVSDNFIAAELSDVNLRRDGPCIDVLQVVTETELISVCNQEDQIQSEPDDASRTIESRGSMKLSFISNSSVDMSMEEDQSAGFTVHILTFLKEKNEEICRDRYHGFMCPRVERCLPLSAICDGVEDCKSGKDESNIICGDSTDSPLSPTAYYASPSILSVVLGVISTVFLLCICFWLLCASRRLLTGNGDGQIIWNLFGSNPTMMMSSARFHRNVRSTNHQVFSQPDHSPPTPHPSINVPRLGVTTQEQPPPPYESLFVVTADQRIPKENGRNVEASTS